MRTERASAGAAQRAMIAALTGLSGVAGVGAGRAGGAPTVIPTNDNVPSWSQVHDYRRQMDDLATELKYRVGEPAREVVLKYKELGSTDYNVRRPYDDKSKTEPWLQAEAIGSTSGAVFTNTQYFFDGTPIEGLAAGDLHCSPTAYGMTHEWMRTTKLKKLKDYGGEQKTIEAFAWASDTNDINPDGPTASRNSNGRVDLATTRADGILSANKIIRDSDEAYAKDGGPKLKAFKWSSDAQKLGTDAGRPVLLSYGNKDEKIGHIVVGVGYDGDKAIVKDPATGMQITKAFSEMRDLDAHWADNLGSEPTGFDETWDRMGMQILTMPDYGDGPSTYETSEPRQARHRDQFAQWLGGRVTGEVSPFDAGDDEDGVANAGDRDGGDDGARFRWNADGTGFADITVTTRDWVREADPEIDGPDGYGHAAADPNLYLSVWADPMHTGSWDTAVALLSGEIVGRITENGTGALAEILISGLAMPASSDGEPYWVRVRLSREAGLGAYGATEYGEVEDYRVPTPGVLTVIGMAAGLGARRRGERRLSARV